MIHTVAVLGLGAMGLPIATNLARSFTVRGYDPDPGRSRLAAEAGVSPAGSAREAADGADAVLLAVRNRPQLETALDGPDGVAGVLAAGAAVILTSTVAREAALAADRSLTERGLVLIDAPVSGGPARAGEGDLLVAVGARDADYKAVEPVLEQMAGTLVRVGDEPGKGQAFKTVNQLLCGAHIAAAAEALALAEKLDLDLEQSLEALMSGAASSFMLGDRGPRMLEALAGGEPEVRSRLDIFVKDMGIVADTAGALNLPHPVAGAARQSYLLGLAAGDGERDDSTVVRTISPSAPGREG